MSKSKAKKELVKKAKAEDIEVIDPNRASWRYRAVISLMVTVAGFLSYRALSIQVLDNDFLLDQGNARHLRTMSLPAHRGMLLDRNGEVLALSSPVTTVWADPAHVDLNDNGLSELARLIDMPLKTLKAQISNKSGKEFVYLKRQLHPAVRDKVKALGIPGISTLREFKRYYPAGEVTSQVVGISDIDEKGIEGYELEANGALQGVAGKDRVLKDRRGHIIDSVDLMEAPQPGQNITLSIDKRLQYIAYRELQKAVKIHDAKTASLVLLDSQKGEVLALANIPSYNPNNLTNLDKSNLRNRAVTDLIEPGSTMKPFIIATALETKQVSPNFSVNTSPGYMRVGTATITDTHNYGELDITGIIKKSSNVGVSKIALNMPAEVLWEKLSDMGFGELTKSHFP
ncbi:MAG: penicillin-binding transpeptidase domain-containing protein, partial [Gammaproteobacteria bacterium]|nr:penicillin-binding transpeptidase domain-containing protein [Gammaproteobacteria bacterium]